MAGVWLLLAYAAWARGGTNRPLQLPLPYIGILILAGIVVVVVCALRKQGVRALRTTPLADPIFYIGLAFLVLLGLQYWNAGRIRVFDVNTGQWGYTPPAHPKLPSAITSADAAEMLRWFFPAWALLLALRSPLVMTRRVAHLTLKVTLANAAALAAFGIFQFATHAEAIFWIQPLKDHFFASFGYDNHAGAFFVLCLGPALGFAAEAFLALHVAGVRGKVMRAVIFPVAIAILILAGANLSFSGMGIAMSWGLVVFAMLYGIRLVWPAIGAATRVNLVVGCVALLCMGYFVAAGFGKDALASEAAQLVSRNPGQEVNIRFVQVRAAARILADNPWFGVGGWGFRYLFASYIDDDCWRLLSLNDLGKANTHNDPMQFLAEFGIVGAGLMALVVVCLLTRILPCGWPRLRSPLVLYPLVAAGLTFLHSLIDLPFRSPAVLYHWLTILACVPLLADSTGSIHGVRDVLPSAVRKRVIPTRLNESKYRTTG